ncbi:hypothetical protein C2845_PM16G21060 [Panicum miliaceum]|uniref:non-specific serine/threonine protein kinase n=1 Tax=Panicum miliaceum TaxID=4540 RepID=A0A3L6PZE3_PANMI|nr:hypothetical protein C2845_PM16G21060 [Panicum miliaceum]
MSTSKPVNLSAFLCCRFSICMTNFLIADSLIVAKLTDEVKPRRRPFPTPMVIGASIASLVVILLVILTIFFVIRRCLRQRISAKNEKLQLARLIHCMLIRVPAAHSIQPIPAPTVPSVELSSMKAATKDFHKNNIIGRGGFGIVYEGSLSDGQKVAIKRLIIRSSHADDEDEKAFDREVDLVSKLRHGNLVQLLAYCKDGSERLLVYEYMKNMSLNFYIHGKNPQLRATLNWEQRLEIILGIADGIAYLHKGLNKGVIHRDIKPSNILLDDDWRPKIADFGTAKTFIEDRTNPTLFQTPYESNLTNPFI